MSVDPNRVAFDRIVASHPWLNGVRPVSDKMKAANLSVALSGTD